MKRILSALLVLAVLCSFALTASAAGFDVSKLKSSPMFSYDSSANGWKIVDGYNKEYSDVEVSLILFLSSTYVEKGWGPDLRIIYYDKNKANYDTVEGLRITVNDKIYSFYGFEQGTNNSYVFGGQVMRAFLNSLPAAVSAAIEIDHTTKDGKSYTATIDPVSIRELKGLADLGRLFEAANLWDPEVTTDYYDNDKYYSASIDDNPYFDPNAVHTQSVDRRDLVGYWVSRNGKHTFEMKSNGGYVTTVPVVPKSGDSFYMEDGIIYKYFSNNPSRVTPNLKISMISDTEIEIYSYQTQDTYTLYKRR